MTTTDVYMWLYPAYKQNLVNSYVTSFLAPNCHSRGKLNVLSFLINAQTFPQKLCTFFIHCVVQTMGCTADALSGGTASFGPYSVSFVVKNTHVMKTKFGQKALNSS